MIHDEDLKSRQDYNEGQKAAAHRVLVELVNLFNEYRDDIRIVGGWVPDLMFPDEGKTVREICFLRFATENRKENRKHWN